jgi:ketosteroid isomerase-like protein
MNIKVVITAVVFALLGAIVMHLSQFQVRGTGPLKQELAKITEMNDALQRATESMDNSGTLALWDDDGTNFPFGEPAEQGKAAIAKRLNARTENLKGWKVIKQEQNFHDIQISGAWASEWANTEQIAQPPEGEKVGGQKGHGPVTSEGKMLLVLHRGSDGKWRIREEAWSSSRLFVEKCP